MEKCGVCFLLERLFAFKSPYISRLFLPFALLILHRRTVAGAILSGYAVLITAAALKPSSKAPEAAAAPAAAAPAASAGTIPGVDSDEFASFIESEENIMKLVDSLDK